MRRAYTRHLAILFPAVLVAGVFLLIQSGHDAEPTATAPRGQSADSAADTQDHGSSAYQENRARRWEVIREVMSERGLISPDMTEDDMRSTMRQWSASSMQEGEVRENGALDSEAQQAVMDEIRARLLERGIDPGRWFGGRGTDPQALGRAALKGVGYFEGRGVTLGDTVPTVHVFSQDGRAMTLDQAWQDRPALIVTGSLTCGATLDDVKLLDALAKRFDGRVNVVLLYTLEAMPNDSPAPGPAGEALAEYYKAADIPSHAQPTTLEQRTALAAKLRERFTLATPNWIDAMDNAGWDTMGQGPSVVVVVTTEGKVAVKQGWFDAYPLADEIDAFLARQ